MSKRVPRMFLSLLAVLLCISIFPISAFASGDDYHDAELPPATTAAETEQVKETKQTGTVTTNGGKLNVRTGAGLNNTAFTQLPNLREMELTDGERDLTEKEEAMLCAECDDLTKKCDKEAAICSS